MKIGLLVNEFFTNELKSYNGFGGYGMLARNYVAEFIPGKDIEIETIIEVNDKTYPETFVLDDKKKVVFFPQRHSGFNVKSVFNWLTEKVTRNPVYWTTSFIEKYQYDGFISLEMQGVASWILNADKKHKVILWLQDPRPESDWAELDSISVKQSGYRPTKKVRDLARRLQDENRLTVITQGRCLEKKGRKFYGLDESLNITYVPNPVVVDNSFELNRVEKDNTIVFLGRLDSVKRPWLYFELAKRLPQYTFYVCGQSHERDLEDIKSEHAEIKNLIFMGHVDGSVKSELLAKSKVLVNTSIHEAIPVSFLEALSVGCLIASCQNPDEITSRFGCAVKQRLGDGYEMVDDFVDAVLGLMENEQSREVQAEAAINYVKDVHSVERFTETMSSLIKATFRES